MSVVSDCFESLQRLRNNAPIRVPVGSPINQDTVALEAGRGRGSIKPSRPSHHALIAAIDEARAFQLGYKVKDKLKVQTLTRTKSYTEEKLRQCIAREILKDDQILNLQMEIAQLKIQLSEK